MIMPSHILHHIKQHSSVGLLQQKLSALEQAVGDLWLISGIGQLCISCQVNKEQLER